MICQCCLALEIEPPTFSLHPLSNEPLIETSYLMVVPRQASSFQDLPRIFHRTVL